MDPITPRNAPTTDSYLLPQEATVNIVLITHLLGSFRLVHPSISISSFLLFPSSTKRVEVAAYLLFFCLSSFFLRSCQRPRGTAPFFIATHDPTSTSSIPPFAHPHHGFIAPPDRIRSLQRVPTYCIVPYRTDKGHKTEDRTRPSHVSHLVSAPAFFKFQTLILHFHSILQLSVALQHTRAKKHTYRQLPVSPKFSDLVDTHTPIPASNPHA